ncbi:MAG: hypothetical protein Q9217_003849 [Psora testacea]
MWMGDYPVLPAKVLSTGEELHSVIDANKETLLGKQCIDKFGGVLPFLPKILSVAKALPLQIHPNKELSEKLHRQNPEHFTDPNHKPEIAIALGPFEVFAGFKKTEDIRMVFEAVPTLEKYIPPQHNNHWNNETLKGLCRNILEASDESIRESQDALAKTEKAKLGSQAYILDLLPRLQEQYSKQDPGTLVALLTMNFLKLNKGDAIYVPADAPHAYLSGNIVECMARSNNVLNTGFCPPAERDSVALFSASLTFSPHNTQEVLLPAKKSNKGKNGKTEVYAPPMSEFDMLRTRLGMGEKEKIAAIMGPSVLFVTSGQGKMKANGDSFDVKEGYVYFVGQAVETEFEGQGSGQLEVWIAFAE